VLPALEGDLQRRLRPCALANGFFLSAIRRSPCTNVRRDTYLMEAPDIVTGLGERVTWICAFWQGAPDSGRDLPAAHSLSAASRRAQ
jgi:hypothetical protein